MRTQDAVGDPEAKRNLDVSENQPYAWRNQACASASGRITSIPAKTLSTFPEEDHLQ